MCYIWILQPRLHRDLSAAAAELKTIAPGLAWELWILLPNRSPDMAFVTPSGKSSPYNSELPRHAPWPATFLRRSNTWWLQGHNQFRRPNFPRRLIEAPPTLEVVLETRLVGSTVTLWSRRHGHGQASPTQDAPTSGREEYSGNV
eukprot:CAMPEP_0206532678 /NCGR_PEP_ID=MMETSP0325_2-20121206/4529_1 /ASSEMBLY_ACC=CAM_ASM_000347 /TAXON_ID=2866 /ORGANISM="Crypthecodinium cohnii, Strain Seligo" /LENGTH=144 /DNA_ID=CAMNT_0054029209 /DNA_START=696 /DNA_END=1132 /DNA_ORIENTATION=+